MKFEFINDARKDFSELFLLASETKGMRAIFFLYAIAFALKNFQTKLPVEIFGYETIIFFSGEILIGLVFYKLFLKSVDYIKKNKLTPFAAIKKLSVLLVLNALILSISLTYQGDWTGWILFVVKFIFGFIVLFLLSFILAFLQYFSTAGRQKDGLFYFKVSLSFMLLFSVSEILKQKIGDYFSSAFFSVYIITIAINALRASWIAYLSKKEKLRNLYASPILVVLLTVALSEADEANIVAKMLFEFSSLFKPLYASVCLFGIIYFVFAFVITLFNLPTSSAFEKKTQELNSLIYLNKLLSQSSDLPELYKSIVKISTEIFEADAAFLLIRKNDVNESLTSKNISEKIAEETANFLLKENSSSKKERKVFQSKTGLNKEIELIEIENLEGEGWIFPNALAAKFGDFNKEFGFLFIARMTEDPFYKDDLNFLEAFADYAWIALENANLLKKAIENEKIEKELALAREIQRKLLPESAPSNSKLDLSAAFVPAFNVGGDYYDFFELGDNKLAFVIADVSGKGISAAFIMAQAEGIFEALLKNVDGPFRVLSLANEILYKNLSRKNFVTAILGVIDLDKNVLSFSRAGHPPLLFLRDKKVELLKPKGLGLGLTKKSIFDQNLEVFDISFRQNDAIVLFTDGIIEARNSKGEEFGLDRLISIIENYEWKNSEDLRSIILKSVFTFCDGESQFDDLTLLTIKFN